MDSFESGFYQIGCTSRKIDLPKTRCAASPERTCAAGARRLILPSGGVNEQLRRS